MCLLFSKFIELWISIKLSEFFDNLVCIGYIQVLPKSPKDLKDIKKIKSRFSSTAGDFPILFSAFCVFGAQAKSFINSQRFQCYFNYLFICTSMSPHLNMPIAQSTLMDSKAFCIRLNTHRLPTTLEMVEEAILTLNTARGISLQKLKKYIIEKYQIEMSAKRYTMMKAHLYTLFSKGTLMTVTGRGLSGSFKIQKRISGSLVKKKSIGARNTDGHIGARQRKIGVSKAKSNKSKKKKNVTPANLTETPPNYVTHLMAPHAPQRNSSATDLSHVEQVGGTPRSAGTRVGRKRRLASVQEPIAASQEF